MTGAATRWSLQQTGMEELRQRMGPQPEFTGGIASGYSQTGARESESWNEMEPRSRRGVAGVCRQAIAGGGAPVRTTRTNLTFLGLW